MEPGSEMNVLSLFKTPNKWSPEHLAGLHIEQHDNTHIAAIVGDTLLPKDDDPCTIRSMPFPLDALN